MFFRGLHRRRDTTMFHRQQPQRQSRRLSQESDLEQCHDDVAVARDRADRHAHSTLDIGCVAARSGGDRRSLSLAYIVVQPLAGRTDIGSVDAGENGRPDHGTAVSADASFWRCEASPGDGTDRADDATRIDHVGDPVDRVEQTCCVSMSRIMTCQATRGARRPIPSNRSSIRSRHSATGSSSASTSNRLAQRGHCSVPNRM